MSENIIQNGELITVINGGDPLQGCPTDWDQARQIELDFNKNCNKANTPRWSFDCGFKLDYDGPLINISSRFYPPKTHYGNTWDGTVGVYFKGEKIAEKKFDCPTLDELKKQVDSCIESIKTNLINFLNNNQR